MIAYLFFRIAVFLFALLPFSSLYLLSDFLSFFLYRILRYRYSVIQSNLRNAFPEKTDSEIESIIKKTYSNLCDVLLEGIKGMTLSLDEITRRYHFKNPKIADAAFQNNQSAVGLVSHYNNWEWGAYATDAQLKHRVVGVSKPTSNKYIDHYLSKVRARFNVHIVSIRQTGRAVIDFQDSPTLFVLIADQSPSNMEQVHWLNFLHQDTAFVNGPEKIARKYNYPVLHFTIERIRRGFYEINVHLLCQNPEQTTEGEITRMYAQELEKQIWQQPENWLWSHKRWKKKRQS